MNNDLMFSSKSAEWETPQLLFDQVNKEFKFDVDLAASADNAKCKTFYSIEKSALDRSWHLAHDRGWLNPPYTRGLCAKFIAKAAVERGKGFLTVMLLPARTDTVAFHTYVYDFKTWAPRKGVEIRFLPGRLKFGGCTDAAPFPSMLVIFRPFV